MKIKLASYVTNTGGQPSLPSGSIRSKRCMIRLINILIHGSFKVDFMKLAASNTQSQMERSDNHLLVQMKVATEKAGKSNHLMNLYTKYGDALYELKKKKKEETDTAEIEEIDEELRFLKGKLTKVKKDMDKEEE